MDRKTRAQTLREAPLDRWVAFSEDESTVVAFGKTFEEAAAAAKKNGVGDPVILKTPPDWTPRIL